VPIAGHVRIGVAIFSYNGGLTFGVTGDYDAAPDIEVLCAGIESSIAELLGAAERDTRTGARAPKVRAAASRRGRGVPARGGKVQQAASLRSSPRMNGASDA
jgi:hypothetical protein